MVVACIAAACVCVCVAVVVAPSPYIEPVKQRAITRRISTIALAQRRGLWWWRWWRRAWWRRVCVCVDPSIIVRAREATGDRATHSNGCARSTARCVAAAVVAACVAAARVCVCVCVFCFSIHSLLDRAREGARYRAAHSNDCARSAARCVAAAAVVAACGGGARVCVCVFVCACVLGSLPPISGL